MTIVWISIYVGLCVLLGYWGRRFGRFPKIQATLCAAVFCFILATGAYFSYSPSLIPDWMVHRLTVWLEGSWFGPFAAGLFMLAAAQTVNEQSNGSQVLEDAEAKVPTQEKNLRRIAKRKAGWFTAFAVVAVLAGGVALIGKFLGGDWKLDLTAEQIQADGSVRLTLSKKGVVLQSTGYTCGAASCANLLRLLKLDNSATEAEMVPLCFTRRWGGATVLSMAVGLKEKIKLLGASGRVRILKPDWETFKKLEFSALCSVKFNSFVNHAIVVCDVDEDKGVLVADPMVGQYWQQFSSFREKFLGDVIQIQINR